MLNEENLAAFCDRHKLSPIARRVINQVRKSPPTRRVQSGKHNVACRFISRKMGMVIQAESHKNELPAVIGWEHDPKTFEYYDQPPKIKLSYVGSKGKRNTYMRTPDFFLLQDNFVGWVECKTEDWLQARAAEKSPVYVKGKNNDWHCPPAEEYAASVGLGFQVRSSSATCWKTTRNLDFLSDYLDERCPEPDSNAVVRVTAALAGHSWVALKELLNDLDTADADIVYKMIADDRLHVRLASDLLTEPERCIVFRDQSAAEAYQAHLDSQSAPALPALQTLALSIGQSIRWDGKVWKILNVGDEDVFFEDSERVITSLRKTVLAQFVKEGVITGLPPGTTMERDKANEIVGSASPRDTEVAMHRYRCLFPEKFDGPPPKSCDRARRKWRALFKRGQELYGSGMLGLLPKIHLRGNRTRRLDQGVIDIMNVVIDELFAKPGERTLVSCWGDVRNRCEEAGLLQPSEIAFRDEIKRRNRQRLVEARKGEKAAYSTSEFYWHLDQATPRHGERPFEIGHIDHTQVDLQFVGSRKGEKLGKAWLTVLLDANSRMILAWVLLFDAPSYRSCMAVIRDCIRRHGRIPKTIVVDKGSDFQSTYFEVLIARLESHKKTRPGSKPRFGSVIERFFGMSNTDFVHNLRGNNQALQKPRQMSKGHDPKGLAVWTLPDFNKAFERFLDQVYGEMEHSSLGMSPKEAFSVGQAQSGILMVNDPKRLEFQFETLKSLTIESNVVIVLVGTYRLLGIRDQSGQLVRRSEIIHFPRYNLSTQTDADNFASTLLTFQRKLPLTVEPRLDKDVSYFFMKSGGCVGILKDWLARCLEGAVLRGKNTFDARFAEEFALTNRSLITILNEAIEGELSLEDVDMQQVKELLYKVATRPSQGNNRQSPEQNASARPLKRRIGERKPGRDKVGVDHEIQ